MTKILSTTYGIIGTALVIGSFFADSSVVFEMVVLGLLAFERAEIIELKEEIK